MTELCAVILAAGEGRRLRPLTEQVPKALCPVGNVPLLDRALARVAALGFVGPDRVAVNASYLHGQVVAHVGDRAHLSVEPDGPLGTSGGLAALKPWVAGRAVLVGNADAYLADPLLPPGPDLAALLDGWDGESVRLLGVPADTESSRAGAPSGPQRTPEFGRHLFAGFSLLPWKRVSALPAATPAAPADLVRMVWRPAQAEGALIVIEYGGLYLDTGTPPDYLAANLHAASLDPATDETGSLVAADARVTGALSYAVVGSGAVVSGTVRRAVVWPGGQLAKGEELSDGIRAGRNLTVPATR